MGELGLAWGGRGGGWGKLPTVRQSYLLSGMHPTTAYFATNNGIHATNRSIDMHPKGIDMHPKVSIYVAPNFRILCTNRAIDMHPKGIDFAPKSSHRFAFIFLV